MPFRDRAVCRADGLRDDSGETARLTAERRELSSQEAEELTVVSQILTSG